MKDDDLLPPEDCCAGNGYPCGKRRAEHVGFQNGGPSHEYREPEGKPNPARYVSAHIQTEWTCSHCGAECDVWGEATEWMECSKCGRYSFLVPFMGDAAPAQPVPDEGGNGS